MSEKRREPSCNSIAGTHDSQRIYLRDYRLSSRACPECGWVLSAARGEPESAERGERIRQLVEAQASALDAVGRHLDRYDKVLMAGAAIEVLYPTAAVDVPSWRE